MMKRNHSPTRTFHGWRGWRLAAGALLFLVGGLACGLGRPPVNVEATIAAGIAATQQAGGNIQATVEAAVAATLQAERAAAPAAGTPVVPAPEPVSTGLAPVDELAQVRAVIDGEVRGAMAQDLALLESLYAPDAVVIDRGGTPEDPSDDTGWRGWPNIARRYAAFFSSGVGSIALVDVSAQINGRQATVAHGGAVLDGTFYPDQGIYTLEKIGDRWLITRLEYGNLAPAAAASSTDAGQTLAQDDGLYELRVGSQHRYEEPWGWDRGDPCRAWESGDFDDTRPNYRGFNVELLLTNNSAEKVPDDWPITFTTANGQEVKACYYRYDGSGPGPGATSSVTFFTVVEQGDFVETITFSLNGQTVRLCLDGQGGWQRC